MKKINKEIIAVVVMTVLVFAGITFSYMAHFKVDRPDLDDKLEKKKFLDQQLSTNKIEYYQLPKIQTNVVSSSNRMMHVEMTISIEPSKKVPTNHFKKFEAQILDLIISTVSQKSPEEMNTVSGKIIFTDQIKNGMNEITGGENVKRIFFSTFSVSIQ